MPSLAGSKVVVTGGAGFIGSHLVDALVERAASVVIFDNLSTGQRDFVQHVTRDGRVTLVEGDVLDRAAVERAIRGADAVFHLAADPEVRLSAERSREHLEQNVIATHTVLDAVRAADIPRIVFTSTSTVYGDAATIPTPEDYGPLVPISIYGASKLASEALVSSFAHTYSLSGLSFRFANVVGPRSNHGVTFDFVAKLRRDPKRLEILGDGKQLKSYVHVQDTVEAMLFAFEASNARYDAFNIGSEDAIDVFAIADVVAKAMGLSGVEYRPTGGVDGGRGWRGDVKVMRLAIDKLKKLGWSPRYRSAEAVRLTAESLVNAERAI